MSILDSIKEQAKKVGANKGKIVYFRPDEKTRVRFLTDMEDGFKFSFHDSFEAGINVPCRRNFNEDADCEYCDDDSLRTRDLYCWSVWDYEAKEVKLILSAVNNCSPVPNLVAMYETYGTLTDRDYVITKNGKGQGTTFSVVPMDKVVFKNSKAKKLSESKVNEIIQKAYPWDEEDEEEKPKAKSKSLPAKTTKKSKVEEIDEDDDADEDEVNYEEMSAKELYALCVEKELDVKPKKSKEYYIEALEEADEEWE